MKVQLDNFPSNTFSVSDEQISSISCVEKRAQIRTSFQWPRFQPAIPYPFDVELFLLLLQNSAIGYQNLTYVYSEIG